MRSLVTLGQFGPIEVVSTWELLGAVLAFAFVSAAVTWFVLWLASLPRK